MLSTPSEPDEVVTVVRKNIQHEKIIEPFAIFRKEQCDPNNKCLKIDQRIQEGAMREGHSGPLVQLTHWVSCAQARAPWPVGDNAESHSQVSHLLICGLPTIKVKC